MVKLVLQGILLIPPDGCPDVIYELMAKCWKTDPRDRVKFHSILATLRDACSPARRARLIDEMRAYDERRTADESATDGGLEPAAASSSSSSTGHRRRGRAGRRRGNEQEHVVDMDDYLVPI